MSSPILSALCRPVSTGFHRLSSINQLPKCWTFARSCSRHFIRLVDKPGSSLSSRLNAHTHKTMSSTSRGISSFTFPVCHGARLSGEKNIHEGPQKYLTTCRLISVSAEHLLAKKAELVTVHFINRDGEKITVKGKAGQNILDTVLDNDLDIDGYGACEGTLSCSTCHLFFSEDFFPKLPKPSDEELDMLDLAYGQTDMSRLGCQVILTKEMDGMTVVVPEGVADAREV